MAADILLYDADYVPVGDDQRQHVEVCRDIAQRVNSLRGDVFRLPEPLIRDTGARVMGLDDPSVKMSKSIALTRPAHAILLLDPPDTVRKKIGRATTDTNPAVARAAGARRGQPARHLRGDARGHQRGQALAEFAGATLRRAQGRGHDAINESLAPIQSRYRTIRDDEQRLRGCWARPRSAPRASPR